MSFEWQLNLTSLTAAQFKLSCSWLLLDGQAKERFNLYDPKGPSIPYLMTLVPNTIKSMVWGPETLTIGYLDPLGEVPVRSDRAMERKLPSSLEIRSLHGSPDTMRLLLQLKMQFLSPSRRTNSHSGAWLGPAKCCRSGYREACL